MGLDLLRRFRALLGGERPVVAHVTDEVVDRCDFGRRLGRIDAGGELVQHAADAIDDPFQRVELRARKHRMRRVLEAAHLVQQVVERVGQRPDGFQAHGRRDPGERVRAAHRRRRHRTGYSQGSSARPPYSASLPDGP